MQPDIASAIHFAHPTRADQRENFTRAEERPGGHRHKIGSAVIVA